MRLMGIINEDECKELVRILHKKSALAELLKSLDFTEESSRLLYENLCSDIVIQNEKMSQWWENISHKYGWDYEETDRWKTDFRTREVFLISSEEDIN